MSAAKNYMIMCLYSYGHIEVNKVGIVHLLQYSIPLIFFFSMYVSVFIAVRPAIVGNKL